MVDLLDYLSHIRRNGNSFILESTEDKNLRLSIEIKHFSHFHRFVYIAEEYQELFNMIINEDFDLEECSFNE